MATYRHRQLCRDAPTMRMHMMWPAMGDSQRPCESETMTTDDMSCPETRTAKDMSCRKTMTADDTSCAERRSNQQTMPDFRHARRRQSLNMNTPSDDRQMSSRVDTRRWRREEIKTSSQDDDDDLHMSIWRGNLFLKQRLDAQDLLWHRGRWSPIIVDKSPINVFNSPINVYDSPINVDKSLIIVHKSLINVYKATINLIEATINTSRASDAIHPPPDEPWQTPTPSKDRRSRALPTSTCQAADAGL